MAMRIGSSRFAIVSNGFADGPAQALRDFLVERGAGVVTVFHPLVSGGAKTHEIARYGRSGVRVTGVTTPLGPPLSFAIDPVIPLRLPVVDGWFGFNTLATARGLRARRHGRARTVVHWCVDFVPGRFGRTPAGVLYDRLDRHCCREADARFELSAAARDGRDLRHGIDPRSLAPTRIVPMGAWIERIPTVPSDAVERRKVVFMGHLVPRQGVGTLLEAAALLDARHAGITFEIIGGGPDETQLRARAASLGLEDSLAFTGFLVDHRDVEQRLAAASVGIAPYVPSPDSFTRHADPGKLKAYLAAGLPVVLTDVPPNARELVRDAGAKLVAFDAEAIADAISELVADASDWRVRRAQALAYAERFNWALILRDALAAIGYEE
jgi:glycosyltransferase involved in cell wall biosynthesis